MRNSGDLKYLRGQGRRWDFISEKQSPGKGKPSKGHPRKKAMLWRGILERLKAKHGASS